MAAGAKPPATGGRTFGIVLAAGSGRRFGAPKQFQALAGRTLVDRALDLLRAPCETLVLALPDGVAWSGCQDLTVCGGAGRLDSLASALQVLPARPGAGRHADVVVIHDCARPLARAETVTRLIEAVRAGADAAVPAWEPPDVIKRRRRDGSLEHVGREGYLIVQSPYACAVTSLREALGAGCTDVVEETEAIARMGGRVVAIAGDPWSHHVVEPRDLVYAARLLGIEAQ